MITLFKKNETNFETNGIGSLDKNILNPEVSWKDNGAFTLEFKYPLFAKHGFEIENSSIVRANDPEGSNLFFVYKITPSMGYVTVLCYQISYKLAFNSINDTNIVNKNGQNALAQMSNATQYPHSFVFASDIQTTATSRVVRKNPIEFLLDSKLDNSFINRWGGHIVRHNFNIAMNTAYGSNKGYTIRHRKDLKGYEAEFDESTVITRIRPMGYDGLMLPEIYVDSPLIDNYTEPRIQQIEYSDVKVKQKSDDEEGFSTPELAYAELRRLANLEFSENKVDLPTFTCKVEFVNLKDAQEYKDLKSLKQILAGDIVKVVHSEDNFSIEAQMVEYKWNPLNQSYISITLGNYTKSFTSTVGKSLQTNLNQVAQQAQSAMNTANGKNTVYSLTHKPSITNSSVEGDLLYLKNGDKTELWILKLVNGKLQWVLQVNDATSEELKAQMQQAQTEVTEAKTAAQDAVDKANASVTAVQANTQLINDVNTVANNAKSQAQTATTNAQTALTSANTAMTNANKAIGDVGKLSEDVSTLNTIANQAKSDADTALINANKGITDAKTALNKAIGVDTRVTTEITNVNNTLATKANSTTVDALSKTVSSQGTAISQNATDIKLKADSTVVNAIKGTVDNQGTLISQNSKDIALKANKTSVDTLTGRVSANETAIDVTAQGVSTLVTKTDNTNTSLSQFKQDYEGFKGTVYTKGQTDTKVSTVQQSVDNFKTTVSNTYSSKAETDSKVTAVQANVDKIGKYTAYAYSADGADGFTTVYPNSNLLDGTATFDNFNPNSSDNSVSTITKTKISGITNTVMDIKTSGNAFAVGYYLTNAYNITVGQTITISFMARAFDNAKILVGFENFENGTKEFIANTNWELYTHTFTATSSGTPNFMIYGWDMVAGQGFQVYNPKAEPGSISTPYMPSEKELTSNDIPKYVGYSVRQSENPKDFSWQPYGGLNSYKIIEATTAIEQNADNIALKANKLEVDTLSGRVLATESSLQIQDGQIKALNTKTDGQTTQIGTLESSYNGLTSTISKIQTDVGGKADKTELSQLSQDLSGFKTTVANTYADKVSVASQITQSATAVTSDVQSWTNNKLTAYSTTQQTATSITNAVASKADKTQITQLSTDINLRVSKGDVTSQINIEAGRTLIDTKQLLLNADTVKFTGSAFIPNSVIQNLSADKITAGTLNAANVNVINLNAKSLTAGTISGTNLSMNLDTGAVQFQKGYIEGAGGGVRLDLDNNYFQSLNSQGDGFIVKNGIFEFYSSFMTAQKNKMGTLMLDILKDGIIFKGKKGFTIATDAYEGSLSVNTSKITASGKMISLMGNGGKASIDIGGGFGGANGIGFIGNSGFMGNLSVTGSKNAIHVTRDGVRATPAYETAESYLGDIGRNYTGEDCEIWVEIDELFSDTVNTDIPYEIFLQAYDDARFWVSDFRSDKFLVKSDKPMARFAWELKAKRRGYESERLVLQEKDNEEIEKIYGEKETNDNGI